MWPLEYCILSVKTKIIQLHCFYKSSRGLKCLNTALGGRQHEIIVDQSQLKL